jgi:V/A-type H+-transporting ATPase subunit I
VSLRPAAARWFELLTPREDAPAILERLAATGVIELEFRGRDDRLVSFRDMRELVIEYARLERRYHPYWPRRFPQAGRFPGGPYRRLKTALAALRRWEQQALPLIGELESLAATQRDLNLFVQMLQAAGSSDLHFTRLAAGGGSCTVRLFVLPAMSRLDAPTGALLLNHYRGSEQDFLLAVGTPGSVEALAQQLAAARGRTVPVPEFISGNSEHARQQVERRLSVLDARAEQLRAHIYALTRNHHLDAALGEIRRLDWFLDHVERLPVSGQFAWLTGWTSDLDGRRLEAALASRDTRAVLHFPAPPAGLRPPSVLHNRFPARAFEPFVRLLGTPATSEADPSGVLAMLVPLMFGYMFGDVGQGLVLVAAGLVLRRRWPLLDVLVVNGIAATLFGFVFGSVFGREDLVPALWVHPMEQPLPVLQVPLAGGVLVLWLGLMLKALQDRWEGEVGRWWRIEAPQVALYLAVLVMLMWPAAGPAALFALAWYLLGSRLQQRHEPARGMAAAVGSLFENLLQLLINTLSFVRVGAFALAHAGLAQAFTTLADIPEHRLAAFGILLVGNLVIIVLEGLVVTIQTTRLVLFEFFIRFVRAGGRVFCPLAAPAVRADSGGPA